MSPWSRTILRLSGRALDPAPERKSDARAPHEQAAAVFRRFFAAIGRIDRRPRAGPPAGGGEEGR